MTSDKIVSLTTGVYDLKKDINCEHVIFLAGSKVFIEVEEGSDILSITDGELIDDVSYSSLTHDIMQGISFDAVTTESYNTMITEKTDDFYKKYNSVYHLSMLIVLLIFCISMITAFIVLSSGRIFLSLILFISSIITISLLDAFCNKFINNLIDTFSDTIKDIKTGLLR